MYRVFDSLLIRCRRGKRKVRYANRGPVRKRLPDTRASITKKVVFPRAMWTILVGEDGKAEHRTEDFTGYLTVGLYPDGTPGELFFSTGKEGEKLRVYDVLMVVISVALQYGVPLEKIVEKMKMVRFSPNGVTTDPEIPTAFSVVDFIARWLERRFL